MDAIPREVTLKLCEEIREANRGKWYSFYWMWCWGCYKFTKGDANKMCFSNHPDNRGCAQVNKRYDQAMS